MAGIVVFATLAEAIQAGFVAYDRTASGFVVRRPQPNGWEQALVVVKDDEKRV